MIPQAAGDWQRHGDTTLGILASGRGLRWGRRDKGLITWRGEPLVGQLVRCWGPLCGEVLINADRNTGFYQHYANRVVCDRRPDHGPCYGVQALLSACETPQLLIMAADLINPTPALMAPMLAALSPDSPGVAVVDAEQRPMMMMLLRRDVKNSVAGYIDSGGRRISGLTRACGLETLALPDLPDDADSPAALNH